LSKLPFAPKLRRFAQNGVVLSILGFFFFFLGFRDKKNLKKKKKKWGKKSALAQKMGWSDHPIFGQGVAGHPIPAV
jgi:hypothetical protein